jgi:hypothetical protein
VPSSRLFVKNWAVRFAVLRFILARPIRSVPIAHHLAQKHASVLRSVCLLRLRVTASKQMDGYFACSSDAQKEGRTQCCCCSSSLQLYYHTHVSLSLRKTLRTVRPHWSCIVGKLFFSHEAQQERNFFQQAGYIIGTSLSEHYFIVQCKWGYWANLLLLIASVASSVQVPVTHFTRLLALLDHHAISYRYPSCFATRPSQQKLRLVANLTNS